MAHKNLYLGLMLVLLGSNVIPTVAQDSTWTGTDTTGSDIFTGTPSTGLSTGLPTVTTGHPTLPTSHPTLPTSRSTLPTGLPTVSTHLPPGSTATSSTSSSSTLTSSSTAPPGGTGTLGPTSPSPTHSPSGTGTAIPTTTQSSTSSSSTTSTPITTPGPGPTPGPTSSGSSGTAAPTPAPTVTVTSPGKSPTATKSPPTTIPAPTSVKVVTAFATVTETKYFTTTADCGTPSPFPPGLPLGCYNEGPDGRALPDFFVEDDLLMTIDMCAGLCPNYTFFGLEYGSQCWCSNAIHNGAFPVDSGQCDTVCAGNAQQICGSDDTLSIYLPPPPPPAHPKNNITFSAAGCYAEPTDGSRALNKSRTAATDMTPDACFNICGTSGYIYAGLEYGDECWCGDGISAAATLTDPSHCKMNCTGDATRACGGREALDLYNGTSHPGPVPYAPFWDKLLNGTL